MFRFRRSTRSFPSPSSQAKVAFAASTAPGSTALDLEVILRWGHSVLHVAHVPADGGFYLGQPRFNGDHIDFVASEELLGCSWYPLAMTDGRLWAVVPVHGDVHVRRADQSWERLLEFDHTRCSQLVPGAVACPLTEGMRLRYHLPGLDVELALVRPSEAMPRSFLDAWEDGLPAYFAASAAVFLSALGALAFFAPPLGLEDDKALDRERLFLISQYLDAASERERELAPLPTPESGTDSGMAGQRAPGSEGEAGKLDRPRIAKRASVRGPKDNQELTLSRVEALAEAREAGMIGLLRADDLGSTFAHPVFGRDESLGNGDLTAQGAMWGDLVGESGGLGGLGLKGPGFGGGDLFGDALGIGVGLVGTIGAGQGRDGTGFSRGRPGGHHVGKGPVMRTVGETNVSGRLPAQVIQRVVRQNFGRFRMCYEQGLARNPGLEGRVSVRFVIGRDGAVSAVSAAGDLPDQTAKSCVTQAFYGIGFPPPQEGIVKVTYPLMFSPE